MQQYIFLFVTFLCVGPVLSDYTIPYRARGGKAWKDVHEKILSQKISGGYTWQAKLDNFAQSTSTFTQHYFVDSQYFDQENPGPVFFMIGGEGPLTSAPGGYIAGN